MTARDLVKGSVAVVGVGAVGSVITYALNEVGIKPVLIHRNARVAELYREHGVKVEILGEGERIIEGLHATYGSIQPGSIGLAFICVKAYDVKNVLSELPRLLNRDSILVMCQNGLGSTELAEKIVGPNNVLQAIIGFGANRVNRHEVRLTGIGPSYIGPKRKRVPSTLHAVAKYVSELLRVINFIYVDESEGYRWVKLGINAGINPVTTILNVKNGVVNEDAYARNVALAAANEVKEVAVAKGVSLPKDPADALLSVARNTAENYSSMLQDIRSRKRTEVDYINGSVYLEGLKVGKVCLVNYALWNIVKFLERIQLRGVSR